MINTFSRHLHYAVIERIERAVEALIDGDWETARTVLARIDQAQLQRERRAAIRAAVSGASASNLVPERIRAHEGERGYGRVSVFVRDHFTCRYCEKPALWLPILRLISAAFGDDDPFPYDSHWKRNHVYWTHAATWEHVVPRIRKGSHDAANVVTACYLCQDMKNDRPGWLPGELMVSEWDGLMSRRGSLSVAVGQRHRGGR